MLSRYEFPGNVRELKNLIERAGLLCNGTTLTPRDLPYLEDGQTAKHPGGDAELFTLDLNRLEERAIRTALDRAGGIQAQAARLLGIGHHALRYRLKRLGIAN